MSRLTLAAALGAGLRRAMEDDPSVLLMGEDVGRLGGVFRVTDGLQKDFGEGRVVDTPLGESGIIGTAIGLAMRGFRPVCEIQFDGFVFPGFDQIVTQLAKMHARSRGRVPLPVVVRIPYGGGIGAVEHHSESPEAYFCHTAGLRVVTPSTPSDGYRMVQQAVRSDDPVVLLEPKRRYWDAEEVDTDGEAPPLHATRLVRRGRDVTIATYGPMVRTCVEAAAASAEAGGPELEVLDLRTLSPLDLEPVVASARRTGRCVVAAEAPSSCSVASEVAAVVGTEAFFSLEAPVLRTTGFDTPYPPARLEEHYLPDLDRVLHAVDRVLATGRPWAAGVPR